MRFEAEGKAPVDGVKASQLKKTIGQLKSYGPCSFASLTDDEGNYVQVAGGRVTCMIERREAASGAHFRAYQDKRSPVFEDGTLLMFGAGKIPMRADEWFTSSDVEEIFLAFFEKRDDPSRVMWRNVSSTFA